MICGLKDILTNEIEVIDFLKMNKDDLQIIDVREKDELKLDPSQLNFEVLHIPLGDLEQSINKIDMNKKKIIFCQKGSRSLMAVSILNNKSIKNSFSLKGGASALYRGIMN